MVYHLALESRAIWAEIAASEHVRAVLREICRLLKMGMPSVRSHVRKLERRGFVRKEKRGVYGSYVSTRNELFKLYKRNDVLLRLHDSGLVGFLADKFVPDGIVLFGSASRGEDVEDSDMDLLVISREKKVELGEFEHKVRRRISLHFEEKTSNIPKELLNNIVNGIVVYGYLEVFESPSLLKEDRFSPAH